MTIDIDTLIKPTIHLNGSSRKSFEREYEAASEALSKALEALSEMTPNGRDYYVQSNTALTEAVTQHRARMAKIVEVKAEVDALWEHLVDSEGPQR
jgi:hypothetical protein